MWPHTVAILIGGQSKRMGSPKHLVELPNGKTMLDMMLQFASAVGKRTVILGGEVENQHCIPDLRIQQGPVAGIESLLHSSIDTEYLVVGCDMPLITKNETQQLLETNTNSVFSYNNQLLGLPLRIKCDELLACREYLNSGGRSIRGFISTITHISIELNERQSKRLLSINSRNDLDQLSFE